MRLLERGEADGWGDAALRSADQRRHGRRRRPSGRSRAVDALDSCDVAIVQHEYGIYGGTDGDEVLQVLRGRSAHRSIVVLHTVLRSPTPGQRMVLERVCALAGSVVVMTGTAATCSLADYAVPMEKVRVIPHGVAPRPIAPTRHAARPQVLTWGLIGPGKGIEWAHPRDGAARRHDPAPTTRSSARRTRRCWRSRRALPGVAERADRRLGLTRVGRLDDRYLEPDELATADRRGRCRAPALRLARPGHLRRARRSDRCRASPSSRPPSRTPMELLETGPGIVVAHEDPTAIAEAVRRS